MAEESVSRREAFSSKMIDILNFSALNLAMAIGYRTGLFDLLDRFETPRTLSALAAAANLDSRYIKEWLGVMVTGGIVEISRGEDGENRFYLPRHCGDLIARRAGSSNLGVYTQEIPLLTTCALDAVVQAFHTGEGIDYDHYPRFQAFMSELADAKHRRILIDTFLPSVDGGKLINRLKTGMRVCDLGCGAGVAVLLMAQAFPHSRFTGMDLSQEVLGKAQKEAERLRLENIEFIARDAATLKDDETFKQHFDYVTAFDAIHDQTHPADALEGVRNILVEGGVFSMVDIAARTDLVENLDHPMGPFLYTVSLMHCMPVGLVNGGSGLGMMWGREMAVEMLRRAGFQDVEVIEMGHDPFNLHFFCRK